MQTEYRLTFARRAINCLIGTAVRAGLPVAGASLLTVRGRRSGVDRTTPVTTVAVGGQRWLVAPYGTVAWVRNARAAGQVSIRSGRRRDRLAITEVGPVEAAPVLQTYVREVPIVRPFFAAGPDSPLDAFQAEAGRHPVFRLQEIS